VALDRYMLPSAMVLVPLGVLGLHAMVVFATSRLPERGTGHAARNDPIRP